jgi:hypothetical protein
LDHFPEVEVGKAGMGLETELQEKADEIKTDATMWGKQSMQNLLEWQKKSIAGKEDSGPKLKQPGKGVEETEKRVRRKLIKIRQERMGLAKAVVKQKVEMERERKNNNKKKETRR